MLSKAKSEGKSQARTKVERIYQTVCQKGIPLKPYPKSASQHNGVANFILLRAEKAKLEAKKAYISTEYKYL